MDMASQGEAEATELATKPTSDCQRTVAYVNSGVSALRLIRNVLQYFSLALRESNRATDVSVGRGTLSFAMIPERHLASCQTPSL